MILISKDVLLNLNHRIAWEFIENDQLAGMFKPGREFSHGIHHDISFR